MTKTKHNPLNGTDGQLMVMAAHRYCLGRRTYIVSACIDWLILWWPEFERTTRNVILRDTIEALQDGNAGDQMDADGWKRFATWVWYQMDTPDRTWCKQAIDHRGKEWPL